VRDRLSGRAGSAEFGPWQTIWKRHRCHSGDGTWDSILAALLTLADASGEVDWSVSVDSAVNPAHHLPRPTPARTASAATRLTHPKRSEPAFAIAASSLSFRSHQIRLATGRDMDHPVADLRPLAKKTTTAATSSNTTSTLCDG